MRAVAVAICGLGIVACDGAPPPISDAISDAGAGADAPSVVHADDLVEWIGTSPLPLTPKFAPSTHDYYVRCAAGDNPLALRVTDTNGQTTTNLTVQEDQPIVVDDSYWIRCLPHDFPVISVGGNGTPTPGYFLLNASTYAMVLDTNGTPVWYARGASVFDVDSLAPNELSFSPSSIGSFGGDLANDFEIHALDSQTVTVVRATPTPTDSHELRRLPNGDHLVFTYPIETNVDLTGLNAFGANETVADCAIQAIDSQGQAVWTWLAGEHVDAVTESLEPGVGPTGIVDVFHCNSIDVDANGNLLVSMRQTNAVFYVDRASGRVLWKLGGTPVNKDGATLFQVVGDPEGTFSTQHDARFANNGHVTLYDDHGGVSAVGAARGVEYWLDSSTKTAPFVWQYLGTSDAKFEGSFRRYADGESVIGWGFVIGDARVLTEVDANGHDVFDVALGGNISYRAIKVPLAQLDLAAMRASAGK